MAQYWLLDWMDCEGIRSLDDAEKALRSPKRIQRLVERSISEAKRPVEAEPDAYEQMVAGIGADLSAQFECQTPKCLISKVDLLVRRTWYYFDTVVVSGLDPRELQSFIRRKPSDAQFRKFVLRHMEVALYVRESRAETMFRFVRKPAYCEKHLDEHAAQAGMAPVSTMAEDFFVQLRDNGSIREARRSDAESVYVYSHPALETLRVRRFARGEIPALVDMLDELARSNSRSYVANLISKVTLARLNRASLGQFTEVPIDVSVSRGAKERASSAAFRMVLPFVESATTKEILAFREHEASDFQAFRVALKKSISEKAKSYPDASDDEVSEAVVDEIIEPALIDIDRKLMKASDVLQKRSAAALVVGTALTTVGLLAFAPLVAPGVVVGMGGILANVNDYLKDRKEVRLSDMYFLWHLSNKALRSHA